MTKTLALWPHQKQTFAFFKTKLRGFDFSDPGTGKTRAMLEVYAARPKPRGRLLVVCPKTLMSSAWGNDIELFTPSLTYSIARAGNREEAFNFATDVVIVNSDGVKWLAKNQKYLKGFDHLIIDEATTFKHKTSQRSKAMVTLRRYFDHRYLMTGTPNSRTVTELWNLALIVDDGKRLGTSFYQFRNSVQTPVQIGPQSNHVRWDDKPGAAMAVNALIADITVRHAFEDVMKNIPANHREVKEFTLNAKAMVQYKKMEDTARLALEDGVVNAVHAASLRTKLLQIASGAVYSSNDTYHVIDTQRYELITALVEEREHSLVFFNWRHQRDELLKMFTAAGISTALIDGSTPQKERDQIVKDYQEGTYQTLLLHPKTGAHGLTLTRGTTTIISSPFYEADLLKQATHRTYRGGQKKVTNTIFVSAKGTVDELVFDRREGHEAQMNDLLDLLNSRRK